MPRLALAQFETLGAGLDHPECAIWDPARETLWAGGEAGQLYRVGLDGASEQVASTGGFVLGLALDGAGLVYACDAGRGGVVRIDPETGEVAEYSRGSGDRAMTTPNYPCFDADGTLYVTDSGNWGAHDGVIWRVAAGGETTLWSDRAPRFTNGCCLAPDRRSLLVVESEGPCVTRIPIGGDGTAGAPAEEVALPETVPDGVAYAADGTLYVACYRPDRIYTVTAGRAEILVDDPQGILLSMPTNVAFAGQDLDLLVAANLGRYHVSAAASGVRGLALERPSIS